MSEENKVTAVEKTDKVKDPRKVELGKRLAKISREAKERKARHRIEENDRQRSEENEENDYIDRSTALWYLIGGVMLVTALGGLYYAYKRDKREIKLLEQSERPKNPESKILSSQQQIKEKDIEAYKLVRNNEDKIKNPKLYGETSRCYIENL